jgi:predicted Holliday junction resolvase-like endonuclease
MTWFLIVVLALVVIVALLAVLVLAALLGEETESERTRIEMEVRRAERRLHDVARNSFEAMLDEARSHGPQVK